MKRIAFVVLVVLVAFFQLRQPKCTAKRVVNSSGPRGARPSKIMIVAHPDDELLWGYRHLAQDPKSWKVICVCCASDPTRVKEFKAVMRAIGVDNYEMWDNENTIIGWRLHPLIVSRIESELAKEYDVVITHNWYGEYGNLQHMAVHRAVVAVATGNNVQVFSTLTQPKSTRKNEIVAASYPSQRWIIRALSPFHTKY